jgi:hypothetical protein
VRSVDLLVETQLRHTPRVKQLSGMFDVPALEKLSHYWHGEVPIDERDWNVGLIVGAAGAGKSSVARSLFGETAGLTWSASSVIDDFDQSRSIQEVVDICSAVRFNTIPSWMKPFGVLSTGEKFRVEVARHLLEGGDPIMIDEFTSVIDRQVAQIGSHAVQKYVRRQKRKFVAVTCHYDLIDWLQAARLDAGAGDDDVPMEVASGTTRARYRDIASRLRGVETIRSVPLSDERDASRRLLRPVREWSSRILCRRDASPECAG